jgi:ribosomal protein S18 acetylase RimI-like enzyme
MKLIDWREASSELVAPLYVAEQRRWQTELDWDSSINWVLVEAARTQGALPGYLVLDRASAVVGWAFYYLHEDVLQVGGLSGRTSSVARRLLDTIMRSPEAGRAKDVSCFVLPDRPASGAFVQRRFDTLRFEYLRRQVFGIQPPSVDAWTQTPSLSDTTRLKPWSAIDDAPDTVRLLASAYGSSTAARCFSPRGGMDGWVHYVRQLIRTPACGVLLPAGSFAVRDADGTLCGVILTTSIGPQSAHVAQIAVAPSHTRQGLGRRLVNAACAAAASEGRRYVTLLVAEDNTAARSLYASLGFEPRSEFLFGWRARPIPRAVAA